MFTKKICNRLIFAILLILPIFATGAAKADPLILTQQQGEKAFGEVRRIMSGLGITVDREILLMIKSKDEVQVQYISTGGRAINVGGFYRPFAPESIWIIACNRESITKGDMAHELAHAWQSTNSPLQDRTIKEGFAMWCQYKVLWAIGQSGYAESLTKWEDPDYGGGLRLFLSIEKKNGIKGVIEFAKTAKQVPKE